MRTAMVKRTAVLRSQIVPTTAQIPPKDRRIKRSAVIGADSRYAGARRNTKKIIAVQRAISVGIARGFDCCCVCSTIFKILSPIVRFGLVSFGLVEGHPDKLRVIIIWIGPIVKFSRRIFGGMPSGSNSIRGGDYFNSPVPHFVTAASRFFISGHAVFFPRTETCFPAMGGP